MKKQFFPAILVLLALLSYPAFSVSAQEYSLEVQVAIYPDGTGKIISYSPIPKTPWESGGEYRAILLAGGSRVSYSNFSAEFLLLTDPPTETEEAIGIVKLQAGTALPDRIDIVSPEGKLILSEAISVCNGDSLCQGPGENRISCPGDCLGVADFLCEPDLAGCDPDCEKEADSDCLRVGESKSGVNLSLFLSILLGIAVFLAYYLYSWKKARL